MRFITRDDFAPYLDWKAAVAAIEAGHRLPRAEVGDMFLGPQTATLLTRASYIRGLGYGVKAVTACDENPRRHLPTVQGGMFFFDEETGSLKAILESHLVTDVKTASDSVCGALYLARKESRALLIIGAGNMARRIAQSYQAAFPGLETIMIWSRRPEQARLLVHELADLPLNVQSVTDLPSACREADIISTVTMAREPVLLGQWVMAGTHIDLIGAYKADMREADDNLLQKGRFFVDSYDSTLHHIGELMIPLQNGVLKENDIQGDLYDLVAGKCRRTSPDEITIFKNGGGAHLDMMIAHYMIQTMSHL